MTSDRTHRMWLWQSGRLPVSSVSLRAGIPSPPPSGGKIKLALISKMTGSRWVTPQGALLSTLLHDPLTLTNSHFPAAVTVESTLYQTDSLLSRVLFYLFFLDRFVEESWRSQIPRRLIQGHTCVWRPTWLEREKVKKLSSQCLVTSLTYTVLFAWFKK